jgi:hypothetical protein
MKEWDHMKIWNLWWEVINQVHCTLS